MSETEPPPSSPAKPEVNRSFASMIFQKLASVTAAAHESGKNFSAAQNEAHRQLKQVASGELATKSGEED